jgi:hypothetical protein
MIDEQYLTREDLIVRSYFNWTQEHLDHDVEKERRSGGPAH